MKRGRSALVGRDFGYAVDYLGQEAATVFPELRREELADALFEAARAVEAGHFNPPPCDHDWQSIPEKVDGWHRRLEYASVFERCSKCRAMRERRIYSDEK